MKRLRQTAYRGLNCCKEMPEEPNFTAAYGLSIEKGHISPSSALPCLSKRQRRAED